MVLYLLLVIYRTVNTKSHFNNTSIVLRPIQCVPADALSNKVYLTVLISHFLFLSDRKQKVGH